MTPSRETSKVTKAVIPSRHTAELEIRAWLKQKDFEFLTDGQDTKWQLHVDIKEKPDLTMKHLIKIMKIGLRTTLSAGQIESSGLLDAKNDARLLRFLTHQKIPLFVYWGTTDLEPGKDPKILLQEKLAKINVFMKSPGLILIKRQIICRYIDKIFLCGSRLDPI